jgi:flagellar FliL protein
MADKQETESAAREGNENAPPKKGGMGMLIGAVAVAMIAGAGVGGLVIGPRIAAGTDSTATSEEHQSDDGPQHGFEGKFFELENLVVNPAGSGGQRFLMVSVAFEVPTDVTVNLLHEREVQVRDVVSATLESQTLETLTRQGAREKLKRELHAAVLELAGNPEWMRLYIPRFVIQ